MDYLNFIKPNINIGLFDKFLTQELVLKILDSKLKKHTLIKYDNSLIFSHNSLFVLNFFYFIGLIKLKYFIYSTNTI